MCAYSSLTINTEYVRDCRRGRAGDFGRFYRLDEYAYRRWERSRDPKHYSQWLRIMESVDRRKPFEMRSRLSRILKPFSSR